MFKIYYKALMITLILSVLSAGQDFQWRWTEGPMGGCIGDFTIADNDDIYVGLEAPSPYQISYGLFKSTDNGESWQKVHTGYQDVQIFMVHTESNGNVWIGADADYSDKKIFYSSDQGSTWDNRSTGYEAWDCMSFVRMANGDIYAGEFFYNQTFKSTDNGLTWEYNINLGPINFATDTSGTILYSATRMGLFGTRDSGQMWGQNSFLAGKEVSDVYIDERNHIYVCTGYELPGEGVFRSTDDGVNWEYLGLDSLQIDDFEFDDDMNIYAGTVHNGLFISRDTGKTWTNYNTGFHDKDVHKVKVNSRGDIFIGCRQEGIYRSTDGGENFELVGVPATQVEALSYDGDSLIYAATANGVHKYNRDDNSWTYLDYAFARDVEVGPEGNVYVGLYNRPTGGLWMSTDRGESWDLIGGEYDSVLNESIQNIETFSDGAIIASLYGRQYIYSENYGVSWDTIKYIGTAIGINDADELYIQKPNDRENRGDLLKSTDRGETFQTVLEGVLYNTDRNSIMTLGKDTVLVSVSIVNDTVRGIWRSFDGGESWAHLYDSTTVIPIIIRQDGFITAGTPYGLTYSTDQGKSWNYTSPDPDNIFEANEIEYLEDGAIFVGTNNDGVWQLEVLVSNNDRMNNSSPDDFSLSQNYPNPFNPSTVISYTLPVQSKVELKVYDILGREVMTLVNKEQPAGRYEVEFNAKDLPSGVYIYQIKAVSFTASRKMLLVK